MQPLRLHIKKLRQLVVDPNVDLWAIDEVHFQQHGTRCRMWIPPEVRDPVLLHHPTRKSVGYFGAVRLRDGKFFALQEPDQFDAQTTWKFYRRLHQISCHSGRRVVVITDNARYHHARMPREWREIQEPAFQLFFLPPYSPELNPIERVWKLVRRLCLHNRYFPQLGLVTDAVERQFAQWRTGSQTLFKLCSVS